MGFNSNKDLQELCSIGLKPGLVFHHQFLQLKLEAIDGDIFRMVIPINSYLNPTIKISCHWL